MENNKLPEEVKKRIEKEAEDYATVEWGDLTKFHPGDPVYVNWDNSVEDYLSGASTEALRAEELRKLLKQAKKLLDSAYGNIDFDDAVLTGIWIDWYNELNESITKALRQQGGENG